MRSTNDSFSNFLLHIGDGKIEKFCIPSKWKVEDVCKKMYDNINKKVLLIQ